MLCSKTTFCYCALFNTHVFATCSAQEQRVFVCLALPTTYIFAKSSAQEQRSFYLALLKHILCAQWHCSNTSFKNKDMFKHYMLFYVALVNNLLVCRVLCSKAVFCYCALFKTHVFVTCSAQEQRVFVAWLCSTTYIFVTFSAQEHRRFCLALLKHILCVQWHCSNTSFKIIVCGT